MAGEIASPGMRRASQSVPALLLSLCALAGSWSAARPATATRRAFTPAVARTPPPAMAVAPPPAPALPLDNYHRDAHIWHPIDTSHPGMRLISEEPYIFAVDDFLSAAEADGLAARVAEAEAAPSSARLLGRGERTSRSVLVDGDEVGWLRSRIAALARVEPSQMQPLKLTRYEPGGVFMRHTDCSVWLNRTATGSSPDPSLQPDRFCTVLIYLNDAEGEGEGGRTCWRWRDEDPTFYERLRGQAAGRGGLPAWVVGGLRSTLLGGGPSRPRPPLCISPRKGMAVVHFPCTSAQSGLAYDPNAEHESEEAASAKYVCQQFIWSAPMDGAGVHGELRRKFAALSEECSP